MDITAIAGAAISSAYDRIGATAAAIAESVTPSDTDTPVDTIDISSAVVQLSEAKIQAAASAKVLKVARDIDQQTLDIFA